MNDKASGVDAQALPTPRVVKGSPPSSGGLPKRRRKPVNLALKTVEWFEAKGWCAGVVERAFGGFRHDYKRFADIIAIREGKPIGIQVCRDTGLSEHRKKLTEGDGAPGVRQWLAAGGGVAIFSWDKRRQVRMKGREVWRITRIEWLEAFPPEFHFILVGTKKEEDFA
jgi:hypothetical protein